MNLSKNLTLQEFTYSNTANIKDIDNAIPSELLNNAKRTAELFEVVRSVLLRPCQLNSGYRSRVLNSAVGGSSTSSHMQGCACDIRCAKDEQEKIRDFFQSNQQNIEFDQLILYWKYNQQFVHIGVSQDSNVKGRKMIGYRDASEPKGYVWL